MTGFKVEFQRLNDEAGQELEFEVNEYRVALAWDRDLLAGKTSQKREESVDDDEFIAARRAMGSVVVLKNQIHDRHNTEMAKLKVEDPDFAIKVMAIAAEKQTNLQPHP